MDIIFKSLGEVFDQRLTLENHVKAVCRTCNFHIKSLRVLRPSLDTGTAEIIDRSIIMSRLDYCNSLLAFTSKRNIHRRQMVQISWQGSCLGQATDRVLHQFSYAGAKLGMNCQAVLRSTISHTEFKKLVKTHFLVCILINCSRWSEPPIHLVTYGPLTNVFTLLLLYFLHLVFY